MIIIVVLMYVGVFVLPLIVYSRKTCSLWLTNQSFEFESECEFEFVIDQMMDLKRD